MSTFSSPADQVELNLAQASSVNNLDAATAAAFALLPDETLLDQGRVNYAVDTGAANAYLVALPTALAAYTDGAHVIMRPLATNTGASTVNVDSLGVKSIRTNTGVALSAGDITVGVPASMRYSTATGFFHLDSGSIASATAAAASAAAAVVSAAAALASELAAAISEAAALVSENAAAASAILAAATISDTAYAASWNGVTTIAPSKNAVYDQFVITLAAAAALVSDTAYAGSWNGVTAIAPSKNAVYDKIESLTTSVLRTQVFS